MMSAVAPPPLERGDDEARSPSPLAASSRTVLCLHPDQEDEQPAGGGQQDVAHLDRRWLLWHDFMKEHAQLDAWLRLAEQAVSSAKPAHLTYAAAKEELKTFERLQREAGPRLVQLDGLTRSNRVLTRLFQGAMRAGLLAAARDCSRRWDEVTVGLEAAAGRLQVFVSDWEEFEAQREELALWLADVDVSLSEVDHNRGNTCEKLRLLQASDSGCPSESLLEEEGALHRLHLDVPAAFRRSASSSPLPPPPSSPTLEQQQVLEWDPSVDVGRSVSTDDADSSYFSAGTGLCHGDSALKRWSFLDSLDSQSSHGLDMKNQEADEVQDSLYHVLPGTGGPDQNHWTTSNPDCLDSEQGGFVGVRVEAWLGVHSPAHSRMGASCSRAVQTEEKAEAESTCRLDAQRSARQSSSRCPPRYPLRCPPALLYLLLSAALVLLVRVWWFFSELPCRYSVRLLPTFNLALRYVNGPPPT